MRLSFAQLDGMLDVLTEKFMHGQIDLCEYVDDWNELVEFAGWTWEEFANEVDKRWTPQKRAASPLFQC